MTPWSENFYWKSSVCLWFSLQLLSIKFLILSSIQSRSITSVYLSSCKVPLLLLLKAHQLKLWKHLSLEAYCATVNFHQHIFSIPVSLIKRQRSLSEAVLISFGSTNGFPKLTSQRLAAAGDVLHCFNLHLAKSAGWISTKPAHDSQMSSHRVR